MTFDSTVEATVDVPVTDADTAVGAVAGESTRGFMAQRPFRRQARGHRTLFWAMDGVIAAVVLVLGVIGLNHPRSEDDPFSTGTVPIAVLVVLVLLQALPLAVRRIAPMPVFILLTGVCLAHFTMGFAMRSDLGLLVALYGVSRYSPRWQVVGASVTTFAMLAFAVVWLPPMVHQRVLSFFFLTCAIVAAIALGVAGRAREAQITALAERATRLETEREQRIRLAIAAERARVSREMHDIVGHNLAVITSLADGGARIAATAPDRAADAMRVIATTSRQALSELRTTLKHLSDVTPTAEAARNHTGEIDNGIGSGGHHVGDSPGGRPGTDLNHPRQSLAPQPGLADLPALLTRVQEAGPRVNCTLTDNLGHLLTPTLQLTIYRIVQEGLTNALTHAGPTTTITITVTTAHPTGTTGHVDVTITDTGPGRQQASRRTSPRRIGGQGLIGLRERARLAGGTATAGPQPTGGWSIHARLPSHHMPDVSNAHGTARTGQGDNS